MSVAAEPAGPTATPPARLSPLQRTVRIFARPSAAWDDLKERGQWLFPLLIGVAVFVTLQVVSFDYVTLPMMRDQWDQAVSQGRMESSQVDQAERAMSGPVGRGTMHTVQGLTWPAILMLQALVLWFGAGFVLGTSLKYRQAFDVICWSTLVKLPELILFFVLAIQRGSVQGVHLGLGVLVPEPETPSKVLTGLATFLDSLGPFNIWWGVVVILGVGALTGAPRRNLAWVLIALYLAFSVLLAAVSAFFSPGA
jgi:hypothetical protein